MLMCSENHQGVFVFHRVLFSISLRYDGMHALDGGCGVSLHVHYGCIMAHMELSDRDALKAFLGGTLWHLLSYRLSVHV